MKILNLLFGSILGVVCWACSSPAPSTSSSSHWVKCGSDDDCKALADTTCSSGYCVDRSGTRVEQPATTGGGPGVCNPLAGPVGPITLGEVIGVGRDAKGVTYVADEITSSSTYRVFMSDGKVLQRRRLLGSAMNLGKDGGDYRFEFDAGGTPEALLIGLYEHSIVGPGGMTGTNSIALGPAGMKTFIGDPGAVTTMLSFEDSSVLSAFTLRNLPGDVTIEYVADVEDGSVIVVTHPAVDYDYTDFRMFYGQPPKLQERHVTNTTRAKSGSTVMTFDVAGATYTASFPWVMEFSQDGGSVGHPGDGTVDQGDGMTRAFTQRWPTPTTLSDLSFTCL